MREEDFDLTLAINLKGTFFASQEAGRIMIGQGFGRIVNLGSQAGFVALPTESVYCMTKAAISHLTRCLAVEWARHGVNVSQSTALPTSSNLPIRPHAMPRWRRRRCLVSLLASVLLCCPGRRAAPPLPCLPVAR